MFKDKHWITVGLLLLIVHIDTYAKVTPEEFRNFQIVLTIAYSILILIPLVIAVAWLLCFLSWAGITSWPKKMDTHHFLRVTGISITVSCTLIAFGGISELFPIDETTVNLLWGAVVSGIVLAVHKWFTKVELSNSRNG